MVRVLIAEPSHISRLPFVADGLALCKLRIPFTVKSLIAVVPPVPLMVKLLTFPVNIEAGRVIAAVFIKAKVALASLASIKPLVRVGELPAIVNVFAPRLNVPEGKSNKPFTVMF
jgi:hypothetical protein